MEFLGHIVTSGGIKADPKKVEAVRKFPKPTSVKFLRRSRSLKKSELNILLLKRKL